MSESKKHKNQKSNLESKNNSSQGQEKNKDTITTSSVLI